MTDQVNNGQWFIYKKCEISCPLQKGSLVLFDHASTIPKTYVVFDIAGNPHCIATSNLEEVSLKVSTILNNIRRVEKLVRSGELISDDPEVINQTQNNLKGYEQHRNKQIAAWATKVVADIQDKLEMGNPRHDLQS